MRLAELLVHDEEGAEPVEVVCIAGTIEVVVQISDVSAAADVGDVGLAVGVDGELSEYAAIAFAGDLEHLVRDVFSLYGHVNCVRIHGRAGGFEPVSPDGP